MFQGPQDECTVIFNHFLKLKYVWVLGQRYRCKANRYGDEGTGDERYVWLKRDKSEVEETVLESDLTIMWKVINGVLNHHSFHEGWLPAEKDPNKF